MIFHASLRERGCYATKMLEMWKGSPAAERCDGATGHNRYEAGFARQAFPEDDLCPKDGLTQTTLRRRMN